MKLSEAIRLGAMLKPQAFEDGIEGASCALRAAMDAVALDRRDGCDYEAIADRWPIASLAMDTCPVRKRCNNGLQDLAEVVFHLNDDHRWPREQIADWVETIERAQEPPQTSLGVAMEPAITTAASEAQKAFACVESK